MAPHRGPKRPAGTKKPALTHFLCIPLVTGVSRPQLERSLNAFREDVTSDSKVPRIHPKAIRPIGALHCTLGVMSLDAQKLAEANDFLKSLDITALLQDSSKTKSDFSERDQARDTSGPVVVDLKSLVSMHSPQSTSILFSEPVDTTERLYPFCLALQNAFKTRGFLVEDDRKLKLHATIVNTIYAKGRRRPARKQAAAPSTIATTTPENEESSTSVQGDDGAEDRSQGHGPNANAPLKIDARALLEEYKEFCWAQQVTIDRIAICEMGAKKVEDQQERVIDERYIEVASIPMPA